MRRAARTLSGLVALLVLASAAHAQASVSFDEAVTKARWKQGYLTGSVRFTGQVTEPATLFVFVRRANNRGGVLASKTIEMTAAGAFTDTLKLPSASAKAGDRHFRVSSGTMRAHS